MVGILLIITGIIIGFWAWKARNVIKSQKPVVLQGSHGRVIEMLCLIGGGVLFNYGISIIFSLSLLGSVFGMIIILVGLFFLIGRVRFDDPAKLTTKELLSRFSSEVAWLESNYTVEFIISNKNQKFKAIGEARQLYVAKLQEEINSRDIDWTNL